MVDALDDGRTDALDGGRRDALDGGRRDALDDGRTDTLDGGLIAALEGGRIGPLWEERTAAVEGGRIDALDGGRRGALEDGRMPPGGGRAELALSDTGGSTLYHPSLSWRRVPVDGGLGALAFWLLGSLGPGRLMCGEVRWDARCSEQTFPLSSTYSDFTLKYSHKCELFPRPSV